MQYKVWLADDEPWILESLKRMLDWPSHGFEIVGESCNGLDAYRQMKHHRPDVAFIDIRMPGMNGIELIQKLYEEETGVCCVVASGYAEFEYARQAMHYGADGYILKPFRNEEISEVLQGLKNRLKREKQPEAIRPSDAITDTADSRPGDDTLRSIEQYIRGNFREPLTVQDISRQFFLHPNYLSSLFKREFGVNFTKFLNDIRMEHACSLLLNSRLSVREVAEQAGYKDYFYFAKMFKRHTGLTPTEYRSIDASTKP